MAEKTGNQKAGQCKAVWELIALSASVASPMGYRAVKDTVSETQQMTTKARWIVPER